MLQIEVAQYKNEGNTVELPFSRDCSQVTSIRIDSIAADSCHGNAAMSHITDSAMEALLATKEWKFHFYADFRHSLWCWQKEVVLVWCGLDYSCVV